MNCKGCASLRLRSINVGGMWVALWGCVKRKARFGTDKTAADKMPSRCEVRDEQSTER